MTEKGEEDSPSSVTGLISLAKTSRWYWLARNAWIEE